MCPFKNLLHANVPHWQVDRPVSLFIFKAVVDDASSSYAEQSPLTAPHVKAWRTYVAVAVRDTPYVCSRLTCSSCLNMKPLLWKKSTTGGVNNIFLGWNTISAGQLLCLFLDESTKKHRGNLRSFQGALQLCVHKSAKTANHFFLFATIWQRRTSLWSIGKCEKRVIIRFRFNQSFRNENDASVPRNKNLDVTFPQRFKFSQKASLRFLQTNFFFFFCAGSEEQINFSQQSLKILKMASESFIQALL